MIFVYIVSAIWLIYGLLSLVKVSGHYNITERDFRTDFGMLIYVIIILLTWPYVIYKLNKK